MVNFVQRTGSANPFNGVPVTSNSFPTFADVDSDGDLDAFLSTNNGTPIYYRNNSGTLEQVMGTANPFNSVSGVNTPPTFADVDSDGDLDTFLNAGGTPRYYRNNSGTLGEVTGTANPFSGVSGVNNPPTFADVDSDGDLDVFLSTNGPIRYYRNNSGTLGEVTGTANPFTPVSGVNIPPTFVDVDNDGDLDAFLSTNGAIRYYRNNFGTLGEVTGTANPFTPVSGVNNPPTIADVDSDGNLDVFLSTNGPIRYYRNNSGTLGEVTGTANPFNGVIGPSNPLTFADVDKDGDLDAFLSTNGAIRYYRNNSGTLGQVTGTANPFNRVSGASNPPTFADVDSDGDLDGFITNSSGVQYFQNTTPIVTIASSTARSEQNPNTPGTFVLTLSTPAPIGGLTINYTVGGSATPGVDYQPLTGSVIIPQGGTTRIIPVTPIPDSIPEVTENISVSLRTGTGYSIGATSTAILGITNFSAAPVLAKNASISTSQNSNVIITNALLQATDSDNTPDKVVYTLTSLPSNGTLQLNGNPLAVNGTFTQEDINNNRLIYLHNGSSTTSDRFGFTISDGIAPTTTRVSVDSTGTQGNNGDSFNPSISADGRYVTFQSYASNLVSGDTNAKNDIFVRDLVNNTTTRVSVASTGTQGINNSSNPSISADGRYVTFQSNASNLVSGETYGKDNIFVRDLVNNTTTRVSVASTGSQSNNGDSYNPSISADGRYVTFQSYASNLVSGDTNNRDDIFVRDLVNNTTTRVSVASTGSQGNNNSSNPSISADGRYVTFQSNASNLVSGETYGKNNIFVRDLVNNTTTRVSVVATGIVGNNGDSYNPSISADGRYVTFHSYASNLVGGDTNGKNDIFVRDLVKNTTTRVSLASTGTQGNNGDSSNPFISADGRYVSFVSNASNLVSGDTNGKNDIFVRDLVKNTTTRVSLASTGIVGNNGDSYNPSISADGRYVTFESHASNLVSGDTNNSRDIFVRDLGVSGNFITANSTIAINAAPTDVSLSATSVDENVVANTVIGTFSSTDPNVGNTFAYTLVDGTGSTDNNTFSIVDGNQLRINTPPNYEAKNSYNIRVQTKDSGGLSYEKALIINVNDVNETPTDLILSATSVNENVAANTNVAILSTADSDIGNTFTYNLVPGTGSADNGIFSIVNGNQLRITRSANFETKNSYNIRVRTTDSGGLSYEKALTIGVNNVNETPIDLNLSAISVNENVAANTVIGTLFSADLDTGNTFTYSLVPGTGSTDNTAFSIVGNELQINTSANFEAKPNYNIRVQTTDQGGLSYEKALTININDVNETPTDLKLSATSVNENVATNIIVGTFSTNDLDTGNTFTYSLVDGTDSTDNNAFSIVNGNQLRINTSTDYETKSSYNIRVRTTDRGGLSYEEALIINVNDVNENSTGISLSANSVDENVAANTIIGTLIATNPDSNNTFTYELISGAGDTDNSAFIIDGSDLRLNSSPNYEDKNSYNIRVASTNSEGLSYEEELTIDVNNLNETPIIATPIADQTATVGSVFNYTFPDTTFSDVDKDSLIYTSTVPDWLNFNPATRTFSGTPSSSNQGVVEIPVIASDSTLSISDTFSLTVFPATPPAVTLSLDNPSFVENGGTTTVTATLARAITSDVTVGLGLAGSASSTDYSTSSSQIVINAGSTSGTTTLTALDDNEFEGSETVVIDILSVTNGAELNTQQVSAAILDDDTAPIGDTSGDDTISGTSGNDRIILTTGINTVRAGNGSDVITGGTDRDILYGDAGNDIINGGSGNDDFYGGEDNDIISGDVGNDRLYGDAGSDRLFGGVGIDRLYGGAGDDLLDAGVGADPLNGGSGADIFVLRSGDGRDTIQDYTDESDKIGLAGGLSFAQLQFAQQVVSGVGVITQITNRSNNEVLATLVGISSSNLTTSDFVSV